MKSEMKALGVLPVAMFKSRCQLIVSTWFSMCEQIIVGPHGVPDPPSLAQMTLTQCTSMSELIFDSGAHPGGQIQQYLSFSALFGSPTKYMAKSTGLP